MLPRPDLSPEVRALEKRADAAFAGLKLFKNSGRTEIICAAFWRISQVALRVQARAEARIAHHDLRHHLGALRWIVHGAHCNVPEAQTGQVQCADFDEAWAFGKDYEDLADFLVAAKRGDVEVRAINANTAQFRYGDEYWAVLRDLVDQVALDNQAFEAPLPEAIRVAGTRDLMRACRFREPRDLAALVLGDDVEEPGKMMSPGVGPMDAAWSLGRYSVEEARTALRVLQAAGYVLQDALHCGTHPNVGVNSVTKDALAAGLSRFFHGKVDAAIEFVGDLTYQPGSPWLGALTCPFVPLGDHLATCTGLLTTTELERNLFRVVERRADDASAKGTRKRTLDAVKNKKEAAFREQLAQPFRDAGWTLLARALPHPAFSFDGQDFPGGDIDAVAIAPDHSVLMLQLKWPIAADEVNEVWNQEEEFNKGEDQVHRGILWAKQNWSRARAALTELPENPGRIVGILVSRTTMPYPAQLKNAGGISRANKFILLEALAARPSSAEMLLATIDRNLLARKHSASATIVWREMHFAGTTWKIPTIEISG